MPSSVVFQSKQGVFVSCKLPLWDRNCYCKTCVLLLGFHLFSRRLKAGCHDCDEHVLICVRVRVCVCLRADRALPVVPTLCDLVQTQCHCRNVATLTLWAAFYGRRTCDLLCPSLQGSGGLVSYLTDKSDHRTCVGVKKQGTDRHAMFPAIFHVRNWE